MAILKFGVMVTDARGKLGGHVFQSNRQVAILRTGYSGGGGIGRRSLLLKDIANRITVNWRAETETVKEQWGQLAASAPIIGQFGDKIFLTAQNMYTRHYTAFYGSGQSGAIDISNAVNDLPQSILEHVEFNPAFQDIDVQFLHDRFTSAVMVYALPVQSAEQPIYVKRLPFIYGEADETPQDDLLWDAFFAKYPNYIMGNPVQFGVAQVNAYGFKSFIKTIYATFV